MNEEYQGADSYEIGKQAEHDEWNGDHVMQEHLSKVFAFHVKELRHEQRQIKAELDCVIP